MMKRCEPQKTLKMGWEYSKIEKCQAPYQPVGLLDISMQDLRFDFYTQEPKPKRLLRPISFPQSTVSQSALVQ